MIFLGLGANLPSSQGAPSATLAAAVRALGQNKHLRLQGESRRYATAPVPVSDQPWYVNAVVALETDLNPRDLLDFLHRLEDEFGRVRSGGRNESRVLDLDLLAYHDLVRPGPDAPILPHPRMHERAFVLRPLAELAPGWRHPASGRPIAELIAALDPAQMTRPLEADG